MSTIAILLCTYRRDHVAATIASLARQRVSGDHEISLIVADNDETDSAREIVAEAARDLPFRWRYIHAPAGNISIARNACLNVAGNADWLALIDDDEIAPEGWLEGLLAQAEVTEADAVFAPVIARFPEDAPDWMVELDLHSVRPEDGAAPPITGHCGNALLRWGAMIWQNERFDVERGKTGGEDTEFFHRLHRQGARFVNADATAVALSEEVPPQRLSRDWLAARRFRMGQSHVVTATTRLARFRLLVTASAKLGFCRVMQLANASSEVRRNFWYLRGRLHRGVCAAVLGQGQAQLYGHDRRA